MANSNVLKVNLRDTNSILAQVNASQDDVSATDNVVKAMGGIVDKPISAIDAQLVNNNSWIYKLLFKNPSEPNIAYLYTLVELNKYQKSVTLSPAEEQVLQNIKDELENLYKGTSTSLDEVIKNISDWNNKHSDSSQSLTESRRLLAAFFIFLKSSTIYLKNNKPTATNDIQEAENTNTAIKKKSEQISDEIKQQKSQTSSKSQPTYRELIDNNIADILSNSQKTFQDKMDELQLSLVHTTSTLDSYFDINKKERDLLEKIQHITNFLDILAENAKLPNGRKYTASLLRDNNTIFTQFKSTLDNQAEQQYIINFETELAEKEAKRVTHIQRKVAGWFAFAPYVFRTVTPNFIQDNVAKIHLTADSQEKDALQKFAINKRNELAKELERVQGNKELILNDLADNKTNIYNAIKSTNSNELNKIKTSLTAALKITQKYQKIIDNHDAEDKLIAIDNLKANIDKFIEAYDGFWVKLSNFFAKISKFFKSDTAKKIDELRTFKRDVEDIKSNTHPKSFDLSTAPEAIRDAVMANCKPPRITENPSAFFSNHSDKGKLKKHEAYAALSDARQQIK